jgi:TatD DNase family protein
MIIDSHCHLDDYPDLPALLANAQAAGVGALLAIGIGDGPATMHRALDLAKANTHNEVQIWATAGIHPQEAHQATPENLAKLTTLAEDPRCLAIGEIGLDYYHLDNPEISIQQAAFIAQMKIAAAARKPIIIHCRTSELANSAAKQKFGPADAWQDLLDLVAEHWNREPTTDNRQPTTHTGIMHCFSGNEAQAEASLAAGFYLSFAGNVTYPKSTTIQAVAAGAPADRILIETDAPFLAPIPLRGQTNEPAHVALTAKFLAELRGLTPEALAEQTTANFYTLFPATRPGANSHLSQ